ncbi:hypothetical protein N8720_04100 [Candidatus Marinimicrobia bacterium]|nr:hypothetical protein [Candidatus Neomarinimicrobiota bacterium]
MNNYKKILWSINKKENENFDLILSQKDISRHNRIYKSKNIMPESAMNVTAAFILDKHHLIRFLIKELDLLLKKNGEFKIIFTTRKKEKHSIAIRSKMQIMHEFSVATGGRYILVSQEENKYSSILSYKKNITTIKENDSINNWSFGIITNGTNNDSVQSLVNSIINQNIPNFEINISGPNPFNGEPPSNVNIVEDINILPDQRGPISIKKNILIQSSKFENICLLHDRYLLPENWYFNMKNYGNYFDFLEIPNKTNLLNRSPDNQIFQNNISDIYLRKNPFLPYKKYSSDQFLQGGSITGKKSLMIKNLFLDHLHWGEFEDVHFSKKNHLDGSFIYIDTENYFITNSNRFLDSKINDSFFSNLIFIFKNLIHWLWGLALHRYNVYKNNIS